MTTLSTEILEQGLRASTVHRDCFLSVAPTSLVPTSIYNELFIHFFPFLSFRFPSSIEMSVEGETGQQLLIACSLRYRVARFGFWLAQNSIVKRLEEAIFSDLRSLSTR